MIKEDEEFSFAAVLENKISSPPSVKKKPYKRKPGPKSKCGEVFLLINFTYNFGYFDKIYLSA